jgi:UDP:flavonoid glycosyltransferase YjiC (YdhE family)
MLAPDLPILRHIGAGLRDAGFRATWPVANRIHVAAVNAVRRRHGLARYGSVFEYYCDGDQVLYADAAELTPTRGAPDSHVFLGPLIWSPQGCQPDWWGDEQAKGQDARRAYITLGSTGQVDLLPNIIGACRAAGLDCLIATAGRKGIASDAPAIRVADYLPGSEAAALASIVVCNGGSATAHQALAQGVPVLGICSNLDQILTMQSIERAGAGLLLRAGDADSKKLGRAVRAIVSSPEFGRAAHRIQGWFDRLDAPRRFCEVIAGGSADLGRAP